MVMFSRNLQLFSWKTQFLPFEIIFLEKGYIHQLTSTAWGIFWHDSSATAYLINLIVVFQQCLYLPMYSFMKK
jgi:hypothetical protein